MTVANYDGMSLDELRQYVLTHREDNNAFHVYIDRSKAIGRMISSDPQWDANLDQKIQQIKTNNLGSQ
jgi:hypothetical protein